MAYFRRASVSGLALRLLMVAVCVLPFAGSRKFAGLFGVTPPPSFAGQPPPSPVNEEDERGGEEDAKGRAADPRLERRAAPTRLPADVRPPGRTALKPITRSCLLPTRPTADVPFRNGLGSPYRC